MTTVAAQCDPVDEERSADGVGSYSPPSDMRHCWCCGGGLQPDDEDGDACGTCRWSLDHLAPGMIQ